jgi:succinate dehydrogenase hydrophobic anchor subunit
MEQPASQLATQPKTGSLVWITQALTGVGLVLLAGLHFFAHHFVVEGGLREFAEVQAYIRNPLIWPLEVLFLLLVTPHALLGVRAVLLDLGPSPAARRRIDRFFWVVGFLTVGYGLWLTWMIFTYPA